MSNNQVAANTSRWWGEVIDKAPSFLFISLALGILILIIVLVNRRWKRSEANNPEAKSFRLLGLSLLTILGLVCIFLLQPGKDTSVDHLLTLLGVFLSAAIALSSTTFISNFMAGIMISRVGHFRTGDFLSVGEHFGRVTEMGLLHTEIQTEHSNLTTFPNLYLVTNPCKVVRKKKTVVSATVSLGYDIPRTQVKELLLQAAQEVPLSDPFVQVIELGDFSVNYKIAGVLENAKHLISTRSKLREKMLDSLHGAGIEIVSPTFMYTRQQSASEHILSSAEEINMEIHEEQSTPETIIFDKADEAESIEKVRKRRKILEQELDTLKSKLKAAKTEVDKQHLEQEIGWRKSSINFMTKRIEQIESRDS